MGVLLPSRCYILYIFSTNINTEYFKHAAHSPFCSSKFRLFHNASFFWFLYYSHFTYRVCKNLNVKLRYQKVKLPSTCFEKVIFLHQEKFCTSSLQYFTMYLRRCPVVVTIRMKPLICMVKYSQVKTQLVLWIYILFMTTCFGLFHQTIIRSQVNSRI